MERHRRHRLGLPADPDRVHPGQELPGAGKYIDLVTYGLLAVTVVVIGVEWLRKRREASVKAKAGSESAPSSK